MIQRTDKLYYQDAYIKEFDATVLIVTPLENGFDVILDRTAFFPEEGGQSADTGKIGEAQVLDAYERDNIVHHITDKPPLLGNNKCCLDFQYRYEKMQLHTAEHILCGIFHKKYGYDNVGFHIGDDVVTFDINAVLSREILDEVEDEANAVVYSNIKVDTFFPQADELDMLNYRSKLDITDNVRIVQIGDVDACACCAPHVLSTGEIGLIKMLHFEKHRGGTRIWMSAGYRALADYRNKYVNISKISAMLSVPCPDTAKTLEHYMTDTERLKLTLKDVKRKYAELLAETVLAVEGNAVYHFADIDIDDLRNFCNKAVSRVNGILVGLCGEEGNLKYIIASNTKDLLPLIKDINLSLGGRGGGKSNMLQGTFTTTVEEIRGYFEA